MCFTSLQDSNKGWPSSASLTYLPAHDRLITIQTGHESVVHLLPVCHEAEERVRYSAANHLLMGHLAYLPLQPHWDNGTGGGYGEKNYCYFKLLHVEVHRGFYSFDFLDQGNQETNVADRGSADALDPTCHEIAFHLLMCPPRDWKHRCDRHISTHLLLCHRKCEPTKNVTPVLRVHW